MKRKIQGKKPPKTPALCFGYKIKSRPNEPPEGEEKACQPFNSALPDIKERYMMNSINK